MTPKEQAAALAKCGGCGAGGVRDCTIPHSGMPSDDVLGPLHFAYCPTCKRRGYTKRTRNLSQFSGYWACDLWSGIQSEAHALMYAAVPA